MSRTGSAAIRDLNESSHEIADRIARLRAVVPTKNPGALAHGLTRGDVHWLLDLADEARQMGGALESIARCQNAGPCGTCQAVARAGLKRTR